MGRDRGDFEMVGVDGAKTHVRIEIAMRIDTCAHLCEFESGRREFEDGPFSDIEHLLPAFDGRRAVEADMAEALDKLRVGAFLNDPKLLIFAGDLEFARGVREAEHDAFGGLRDIDEASDAGESVAKAGHVDASLGIHFYGAENGDIEATSVVEVKLRRLIDNGFWVCATSEAEATCGQPTDGTTFDGEGEVVEKVLFGGEPRNSLGQTDAEVDDLARLDFFERALRNQAAIGEGHRGLGGNRARGYVRRVELLCECLVVIDSLGDDDVIDENTRNPNAFGVRYLFNQMSDLSDDDSAVVFCRLSERKNLAD